MQAFIPENIIKEYNKTRGFFKRGKICYAPFNALRFSLSGNIYSCCYNRFYSLGKYPEVGIKEAWFGESAEKLREAISRNDLSQGCYTCYSKLTQGNYNASGSKIYDIFKTQKAGPSLMDFELSNVCNLECVMCNGENSSLIRSHREKGDRYPIVYDDAFVEQLDEFTPYLKEVRFVGGEPFLIDIYQKIWNKISSKNKRTKISILSNGTILNDRIIDFYKNNNVHLSFSIDSIKKDNYESIRINASYDKVMNTLKTIRELSLLYKRDLTVNICPIRKNMWEIPEMVNHFSALNIPVVIHNAVYPSAEVIGSLSSDEIQKYYEFLSSAKVVKGGLISINNALSFESFKIQVKTWQNKSQTQSETKNKSLSDLKNSLLNNLSHYIVTVDKAVNSRQAYYENILNKIIDEMEDKEKARKALTNLISIDPVYIVSEFETSSFEKIKERFNTLGI